ncbi:hypothetical protein TUM4249_34190 [Shewanella sp. KT0246]|nr:hypothetical protein TUM4249_34190 [Shewanella sp. KT0246]
MIGFVFLEQQALVINSVILTIKLSNSSIKDIIDGYFVLVQHFHYLLTVTAQFELTSVKIR